MAFNINAQIILSQPKNLNNVTKQISKQLSKSTKIDLKIGNVRQLTTLNKQLTTLNNSLTKLNSGLSSTRSSISALGNSFNSTSKGVANAAKAQGTLTTQVTRANQSLKAQGGLLGTLGTRFGSVAKQAIAFGAISRPIYDLQRALTGAVKDAVAFEREIVKISQVTGRTVTQLDGLTRQITTLSKELGISANELAETSRVIAQAGIRGKDLQQVLNALARSTLAPTFGKITDTTEGLIAAFGQFGLKGKDAEKVLGSLNQVSKDFAVEAEDLISVIRRTGGVFAQAAGNTKGTITALQELTAVFTAVRSSTRESADTIAAGLRTIFSRIQRRSTISFLKQFGIDLVDAQGKFVGIFPAFDKLSQRLEALIKQGDALTLSAIAEELGGIRQIGKLLPAIAQFDKARKALTAAQKGAVTGLGTDVAKALDTIDNRVKRIRESFNALIRQVFESDAFQTFSKGFLSGSQAIIDAASSIFKAIEPILPLLTTLGTIKLGGAIGGLFSGGVGGALGSAASTVTGSATAQAAQKTANLTQTNNTLLSTANNTLKLINSNLTKLISVNTSGFRSSSAASFAGRRRASGGKIFGFNRGGIVPGTGNNDTVPAMLTPGEFVIKKSSVESIGAGQLASMNKYAGGGLVSSITDPKIKSAVSEPEPYALTKPAGKKFLMKPESRRRRNKFTPEDRYELNLQQKRIDPLNDPKVPENLRVEYQNARDESSRGFIFEKIAAAVLGFTETEDRARLDGIKGNTVYEIKSRIKTLSFNEAAQKVVGAALGIGSVGRADKSREKILTSKSLTTGIDTVNFGDIVGVEDAAKVGFSDEKLSDLEKRKRDRMEKRRKAGKVVGVRRNSGGSISGQDTVPALLTPGEFVFNKESASRIGYGNLNIMNKQGVVGFNKGGVVGFNNGGKAAGGAAGAGIGLLFAVQGLTSSFGDADSVFSNFLNIVVSAGFAIQSFGSILLAQTANVKGFGAKLQSALGAIPGGGLGGAAVGGILGAVIGKAVANAVSGKLEESLGFKGSKSLAAAIQRGGIEGASIGGGAGALGGAKLLSFAGPFGTAAGAAAGGLLGGIIGKAIGEFNARLRQATFESAKNLESNVEQLDKSLAKLNESFSGANLVKVTEDLRKAQASYTSTLKTLENEIKNEITFTGVFSDVLSNIGFGDLISGLEEEFGVALTSATRAKFAVTEAAKRLEETATDLAKKTGEARDKAIQQFAQDLARSGQFKAGDSFDDALQRAAGAGDQSALALIELQKQAVDAAFELSLIQAPDATRLDKAVSQTARRFGPELLAQRAEAIKSGQTTRFLTDEERQGLRDQGFSELEIGIISNNLFFMGREALRAAEEAKKAAEIQANAAVVLNDFRISVNTFVNELNKASKQLNFDIAKISGTLSNLEGRFEDALAGRRTTRLERLENPFTAGASIADQQAALDKIGDVTGVNLSATERALKINEIFESSLQQAVEGISDPSDVGQLGDQLIANLERELGANLPDALKNAIINQVNQAGGGQQGTATAAEIAKQLLESGDASKLLGEQFSALADSSSNLVDVYNKVIAQIEKNIALETRLLDAKVENEKKFAEARIKDQAQLNRISGRRSDPFRDALVNRQERLSALGQGRGATAASVAAERSRLKAQFDAQQKALSADPANDALQSSLAQTQSELNSNTKALTLLSNQTEALAALEAKAQRAGQNAADLRGGLQDILTAIKNGDVETVGAIVSQQVSVDKALRGVATIPEAFEAVSALNDPAIAALVNQITGNDFGASDLQNRLLTQLGNIAAAQGGPAGRATSNLLNGILLANQKRLVLEAEAKRIQEEQNQARRELAKNTRDSLIELQAIKNNTDALGSEFGKAVSNFEKAVDKLLKPPVAGPAPPPVLPSTGGFIGNGSLTYKAAGGNIFKPRGTDTVPAMLTPGEYVVKKSAVDQYGPGVMQAINNGSAQVYASTGGKVGRGVIYRNGGGVVPGPDNNWNGYGSQKVYLQAEAGRERRRKEAEEKERVRQRREKQYNDLEAARKRREGDNYKPTPNPFSIKPIITDDERIQDDQPLSPRPIYNSAGGSGNDTPIEAAERAFGATPTEAGGMISEDFNKGISSSNPAYIPLISLDPNTSFSSTRGIGAQFDEQLGYKDRKDALGVLLKKALAVEKAINETHGLNRNRMALANEAFNTGEIGKAALFLRKFYDEGRATSFVGAEKARRQKKQDDAKAAKERQERVNRFADERSSDVLKEQIGNIDVKERQFLEDAGDNLTELDRKQITAFRKQRSELSDALKLRESNDQKNRGLSTIVALKSLVTGGGFKGAAGSIKERGLFEQGESQRSASELFNDIYKAAEAAGISGDELRDDNAVNLLKRILALPDKQFNKAIPHLGGFSLGDEAAKKEWASLRTSVLEARSGKGNPDLVAGDPTLKGPLGKGIDLLKGGIRAADELALGGLGGDAVDFIGGGQRVNRNVTSRSQAFASDFGSDVANINQEIDFVAGLPLAVASLPSLVKGGVFAATKLGSVVKSTKAASTAAENLPTFRAAAQQIKNGAEAVKNSKAVQKFKDIKQSVSDSTAGIRNVAKSIDEDLNKLATGIGDDVLRDGTRLPSIDDRIGDSVRAALGDKGAKTVANRNKAALLREQVEETNDFIAANMGNVKKLPDKKLEELKALNRQRIKEANRLEGKDGIGPKIQKELDAKIQATEEATTAVPKTPASDLNAAAKNARAEQSGRGILNRIKEQRAKNGVTDTEADFITAQANLEAAIEEENRLLQAFGTFDPRFKGSPFRGGKGAGPGQITPNVNAKEAIAQSNRAKEDVIAAQKAFDDAKARLKLERGLEKKLGQKLPPDAGGDDLLKFPSRPGAPPVAGAEKPPVGGVAGKSVDDAAKLRVEAGKAVDEFKNKANAAKTNEAAVKAGNQAQKEIGDQFSAFRNATKQADEAAATGNKAGSKAAANANKGKKQGIVGRISQIKKSADDAVDKVFQQVKRKGIIAGLSAAGAFVIDELFLGGNLDEGLLRFFKGDETNIVGGVDPSEGLKDTSPFVPFTGITPLGAIPELPPEPVDPVTAGPIGPAGLLGRDIAQNIVQPLAERATGAEPVSADDQAARLATLDEELKRNKALRNFRNKYNSFILRGEAFAGKFGLDPSTNRFLAEADTYQQQQLDYLVGIGSITADMRQKVDAEIAAQKVNRGIGSKTSAAEAAAKSSNGSQYKYELIDGGELNRKQREQIERRFNQTGQLPRNVRRVPIVAPEPAGSGPLAFNKGGEVPIMAQTGEFVMNRQAVQRNGIGMLSRMNQGLPTFHSGGYVGAQYRQAGGRIFGRQSDAPSSAVTVNGADAAKELNNAIITGGETVKASWQQLFDTVVQNLDSALSQASTIPNQINATVAPVQIEGVQSFTDALSAQLVPKIIEQIAPLINKNSQGNNSANQGDGLNSRNG